MIKDKLNQLVEIATNGKHSKDVLDARQEYQTIAGNIYEDDKSYESKMALFLEWYIFDRIIPNNDQTLLEKIICQNKETEASNLLKIYEQFNTNIHALFIVKKIREYSVRVLNLFDNEQYEVNEPSGKLLFSKSCIFEGRIIPYDNTYYFSGSFCFHPEKAKKFINRQIKLLSDIKIRNKKELKNKIARLNNEKKGLNKIITKIDKLKINLLKSFSEKKILAIKTNLTELETKRPNLEEKCSHMENDVTIFNYEKIYREEKALRSKLIQRLSYMQLVWERSRLIDIQDIYHN